MGGQGLNTGVQDAVNLGWKLGQVISGTSPDSLLDSYHAERHPVAQRVLRNALAQMALLRPDERTKALRDTVSDLLGMDQPRACFAAMMSGLDIRYDLGAGHPLLGRRMPDLDLVTADGPLRVFDLLRDARPLLLKFGDADGIDIESWADRVRVVCAKHVAQCVLPVLGTVSEPPAVLIRPDGHAAWVGAETDPALRDILERQARHELTGEQARDEIHRQVTESVRKGARLLVGGKVPDRPGAWYPPTVLTNVLPGQPAHDEEVFGPVAAIIAADDEADAIRIANASEFGLGSGVLTTNLERGRRIASEERHFVADAAAGTAE